MTADDAASRQPDELDLLRQEAITLGMPGEVAPASVGITLRSSDEILKYAKARLTAGSEVTSNALRARGRRRPAVRIGVLAAAVATVGAVILAPWQQNHALAEVPPILEYQFADMRTIADAPGKDARSVLLALSAQAKAQSDEGAEGTTQLVRTENWYAEFEENVDSKLVPSRHEKWLRAGGSIRIRQAFGQPLNLDGRGLSITEKTEPVDVHNETYPADEVTGDPQFVAKLGNDYRKVRAALLEVAGCEDKYVTAPLGQCLYDEISSTFMTYVIPPHVAAAFWRILADDPSLRSLGTVKDRAGRPGIGISLITEDHPEFRDILIISSETGQLLGSEEILIKNVPGITFTPPAILSFTAILESRFTRARGPSD